VLRETPRRRWTRGCQWSRSALTRAMTSSATSVVVAVPPGRRFLCRPRRRRAPPSERRNLRALRAGGRGAPRDRARRTQVPCALRAEGWLDAQEEVTRRPTGANFFPDHPTVRRSECDYIGPGPLHGPVCRRASRALRLPRVGRRRRDRRCVPGASRRPARRCSGLDPGRGNRCATGVGNVPLSGVGGPICRKSYRRALAPSWHPVAWSHRRRSGSGAQLRV
jgi:hypothetical protein